MNKVEQEKLAFFEEFYFWHKGRRELFLELLSRFLVLRDICILDYGCGPGGNIVFLRKFGSVIGVDISDDAISIAQGKGFKELGKIVDNHAPYPDESFKALTCLDVLEHISDDVAALREINRLLEQNGLLLVSVPVFKFLWSEHDEALSHVRRYKKKEIIELISKNFTIQYTTYYCMPGFFAHLIRKISKKLFPREGGKLTIESEHEIPKFLNSFLLCWLRFERFFSKYVAVPFGTSIVIIAIKK